MYKINSKKKGFTLIELLVVVAIISLLSSVVMASLNSARAAARDVHRRTSLKQVATALELVRKKLYNQIFWSYKLRPL